MKMMEKNRTIVHVDMDAFYASVEQLDNAEYRNKPVVVGADPKNGKGRGVVSACSYEARNYGIHSAQPISRAYGLCPHAIFLRPRFKRYTEISNKVMEILEGFSPVLEQISIDEAFLDCTGTQKLFGSGEEIAKVIKEKIQGETGLTASVGVAPNKSVAKICSEIAKPDGLMVCLPGMEKEFLEDLSLSYLWGAGKKTIRKLEGMGFSRIGEVGRSDREMLEKGMGKMGLHLWLLANGIDEREVITRHSRKSISEEITFQKDTDDGELIERVLFQIADRLTRRMRDLRIAGRTITLKIRLEGFETFTRSKTLERAVSSMSTVRDEATRLFRLFEREHKKVRLIGIGVSNLEKGEQLDLFSETDETDSETEKVFDIMKGLYGDKITRGAFLKRPPDK
ncbi:MAG: DNA polymerase IV [Spirochaetota bacterium]|nr:MAG: DNA polymerase IV [Spirochaetota bacterium]